MEAKEVGEVGTAFIELGDVVFLIFYLLNLGLGLHLTNMMMFLPHIILPLANLYMCPQVMHLFQFIF